MIKLLYQGINPSTFKKEGKICDRQNFFQLLINGL